MHSKANRLRGAFFLCEKWKDVPPMSESKGDKRRKIKETNKKSKKILK